MTDIRGAGFGQLRGRDRVRLQGGQGKVGAGFVHCHVLTRNFLCALIVSPAPCALDACQFIGARHGHDGFGQARNPICGRSDADVAGMRETRAHVALLALALAGLAAGILLRASGEPCTERRDYPRRALPCRGDHSRPPRRWRRRRCDRAPRDGRGRRAWLDRVAEAPVIARRTKVIAMQSIVAGLALSGAGMIAAAFGFLAPVASVLFREAIDMSVIFNALRALGPGQARDPYSLRCAEVSASGGHRMEGVL